MRYLTAKVDRLAAGRFGLNAGEIQDALRVWVDGHQVGLVLEGQIRTPLVVRGSETSRRSSVDFARLPMVSKDGRVVELSQLAEVQAENGPLQVIREEGRRFATVLANVSGRDLVGFVKEAKNIVAQTVKTPQNYSYQWGGQFENQQRASARLSVVVPIALAIIFLLLYFTFNSSLQATLVFCNVPFAAIGGILALWLSGEFLSVPASVGFIALIGIAVLNGVV
jgi:cobalt-zinc-cadmium resistance protein CzcA